MDKSMACFPFPSATYGCYFFLNPLVARQGVRLIEIEAFVGLFSQWVPLRLCAL
jgi:hypothetical protein